MTLAPDRTSTATALQDSLVELIDLSLQAKHYHWNVTGPDGRRGTLAATSPLAVPGEGWQRDVEAVTAMRDRLTDVATRIERRAGEIGESDLVTQGLLLEIAGGLAKHAWMLRVQAR